MFGCNHENYGASYYGSDGGGLTDPEAMTDPLMVIGGPWPPRCSSFFFFNIGLMIFVGWWRSIIRKTSTIMKNY